MIGISVNVLYTACQMDQCCLEKQSQVAYDGTISTDWWSRQKLFIHSHFQEERRMHVFACNVTVAYFQNCFVNAW